MGSAYWQGSEEIAHEEVLDEPYFTHTLHQVTASIWDGERYVILHATNNNGENLLLIETEMSLERTVMNGGVHNPTPCPDCNQLFTMKMQM